MMFRLAYPNRVEVLTRELEDELLLYDLQTCRAYCLNKAAARIWLACDGGTTVAEIVRDQWARHNMPERMVLLALRRLERAKLLRSRTEFTKRNAVSRREVLRGAGIVAGACVPLVTSLVVPPPAAAASCFPVLHSCTNNLQCCSGHCGVSGVSLVC